MSFPYAQMTFKTDDRKNVESILDSYDYKNAMVDLEDNKSRALIEIGKGANNNRIEQAVHTFVGVQV